MGYLKIPNLYKDTTILLFKQCYALEKIHGTSTHIKFNGSELSFFSGGMKQETFESIFNKKELFENFLKLGHLDIVVYGEGYGSKQQGMSKTYGKDAKFIAFDVKIGDVWLDVEDAMSVAEKLNLEFVYVDKIYAIEEYINEAMLKPSMQAIRNGMGLDKISEGVVLRPLVECYKKTGERIIVKHKNPLFAETAKTREIGKIEVVRDAEKIALDWVTDMRLTHVLDKLNLPLDFSSIPGVCKAMQDDIELEGKGEIDWSKEAKKEIGRRTVQLYKQRIMKI